MDVYAALADPVRRDLLRRLAGGPARVSDLAADHPISRPAISRHLRLLREAGLVEGVSVGREHHHRLRPAPLDDVGAFIAELTPAPPVSARDLDALSTEVRRTVRERRADPSAHPSQEETA